MKNNYFYYPGLVLIVCLSISCIQSHDEMFPVLNQQDEVVLLLGKYGLDVVPPQIREFKKATYLNIINDTAAGWKAYPPWSAELDGDFQPPFEYLPEEILELTNLKELHIADLNLCTLPGNIHLLKNLEHLDVSANKLDIAVEIPKLKKLHSLKRIDIYFNEIDTAAIQQWQQENPQLQINYN